VIHPEDEFFLGPWQQAAPGARVEELLANDEKHWVRWPFGCGDQLVGRGMTIGVELKDCPVCSATCDPHCQCRRWLPLGNIIALGRMGERPRYVESGFGLEYLASVESCGDLMAVGIHREAVSRLLAAGHSEGSARERTRLGLAIVNLLGAGCQPGKKGAAYVLRKLIRRFVDVDGDFEGAVRAFVSLVPEGAVGPDVRASLTAECEKYRRSISRGVLRARSFVRQRCGWKDADLVRAIRSTYGLPEPLARQIVRELRSEGADD
jgi:hypothetical protein